MDIITLSKEAALKRAQSEEVLTTLKEVRSQAANSTPVLANAKDLKYKAFTRPYIGDAGTHILVIIANGWYFPTPQVDLYFEQVRGTFDYKLMQNNSSASFNLLTYHSAQYTAGLGILDIPSSIVIEDAHGKHTIEIENLN